MKGPPPRAKHKRPERIDLNKQKTHESKRIKSDKACANQNQHETKKKKWNQKIHRTHQFGETGSLSGDFSSGLYSRKLVAGRKVEGHRLVKQQAEQPERPAVHQVVRVGLVEPSEYLLQVVL